MLVLEFGTRSVCQNASKQMCVYIPKKLCEMMKLNAGEKFAVWYDYGKNQVVLQRMGGKVLVDDDE